MFTMIWTLLCISHIFISESINGLYTLKTIPQTTNTLYYYILLYFYIISWWYVAIRQQINETLISLYLKLNHHWIVCKDFEKTSIITTDREVWEYWSRGIKLLPYIIFGSHAWTKRPLYFRFEGSHDWRHG